MYFLDVKREIDTTRQLTSKYSTTQPFNITKLVEDEARISELISNLVENERQIRAIIELLHRNKDLTSSQRDPILMELQKLLADIEMEKSSLIELRPQLQSSIIQQQSIQDDLNQISKDIENLESQDLLPNRLQDFEHQLVLIRDRIQKLKQEAPDSEFAAIETSVDNLQKKVDEANNDRLSQIGNEIKQELESIQILLQKADEVQQGENVNLEELQKARNLIEASRSKLQNVADLQTDLNEVPELKSLLNFRQSF